MAIKPAISLKGLRSSASQTGKTVKTIQSSLNSSAKQKKNLYSSIKILKKRREDRDKRNLLQTQLLAPTLVRSRRGPKSLAITTQQGLSIGDRLIGFLKYATAGWILGNLPTWVALGNRLVGRLRTAGGILSNYGDETLKVLTGITNVFGTAFSNILSFDFLDSSSKLKNSFEDLMTNVDDLGKGIMNAFNVILQPFTDIPPLGSDALERERQQQEGGGQPPPSSGIRLPDPKSAEMYRIAAALSTEGSGKQSVVDMMQVVVNRKAQNPSATYTALLSAPNQFEGVEKKGVSGFKKIQTLEDASRWSGQSKNALLGIIKNIQDPALQASASKHVGGALQFRGSPATVREVNSDSNPNNNIQADANGRIPGSSWRGGNGDNQFITSNPAGAKYIPIRPGGAATFNLPSPQAPTTQPQRNLPPNAPQFNPNKRYRKGDVLTGSIGRGVDYVEIGDTLGAGRNHQGIDIFCPYGTYIALRLDCEVVFAGWQNPNNHNEGYGRVIDVWVPNLGVQLRFGHCAGFLVTSGKVKAGKSFARVGETGNARGAHIHLEYSKTRNSSSGNSGDPSPYIPYILLTTQAGNPTAQVTSQSGSSVPLLPISPAAITQEEQQAQIDSSYREGLAEGITQERQGRKVVVIDDRSSPIIQQVMAGGGGDGISFSINESSLLNNFIRNKLLLDLNYV